MTGSASMVKDYQFSASDTIFLDANIWLYLYGPQADPRKWQTSVYSTAFKRALKAKCRIFIDVLILSEFVNVYGRMEHKAHGSQSKWKDFRKSRHFPAVGIADAVRRIMKYAEAVESGFPSMDMAEFLAAYEAESPDFNDAVFVHLCRAKGFTLITHDADFKGAGLNILTANKHLLS